LTTAGIWGRTAGPAKALHTTGKKNQWSLKKGQKQKISQSTKRSAKMGKTWGTSKGVIETKRKRTERKPM